MPRAVPVLSPEPALETCSNDYAAPTRTALDSFSTSEGIRLKPDCSQRAANYVLCHSLLILQQLHIDQVELLSIL